MYRRENSRKNHPSFSSTLLDEIYRSIDDNTEDSMYFYRDNRSIKGPVNIRGNGSNYNSAQERPGGCLVDKWMEDENVLARRDSLLSENKDEFLNSDLFMSTSSRVSCFSSAKPVRSKEEPDEYWFKSKSRALKIYASLRKVKQPISPGGKLTSFINSLFNHAKEKKLKKVGDLKSMEYTSSSNCSSASSYSRSCLSKNSRINNGIQRRVRFDPVSVILNEESKSINGGDPNYYNLRRLRVKNHWKVDDHEDQDAKIKTSDIDDIRKNIYYTELDDDDDDDTAISDSSSDLFELDHLSLFGHTRFCQELPMYETTHHYGTNRAIN